MGMQSTDDPDAVEYLRSRALVEERVIADGNCLFRATLQTTGISQHGPARSNHMALRHEVTHLLRQQGRISPEEYRRLRRPGEWGDDICIGAICEAAMSRVTVVIMRPRPGEPVIQHFGRQGEELVLVH